VEVADKKGALAAGKDGDIVIFNDNIEIEMTIIKGKIVYNRKSAGK
jgi:N-acetylglucosamine-6-phosphate deacetylase